ncbi:HAD family hydrolase [Marinibacterium profundimaris]|uniref:CbbY/CbbZ/GpH/YieH n=1 Tax=Marinibacterium profundimaris TaxID=1679460 RepID=A0A225NMD7_9RHOB|nr:HAD family phosphatase [Marinibacterium profundimaris]OWU74734.1 CbbY/CbbZ/GpH/YieH [Marinibacterium profundimaris]
MTALLFDLDGTLIHSDALHIDVFGEIFAERGLSYSPQVYAEKIHGRHNLEIFPDLFPGEDPQALSDEKEARFRDRLTGHVPPMPGAEALLERARKTGWDVAVVTNAPRDNAEHMLRAIGLRDAFELLIIGDECARGKPDPEPYLAAMRGLGVSPEACVAFEDSPSGMRAARASGAYAVGIRSSAGEDTLRAAGAHETIEDFTDAALEHILARFDRKAMT